MVKFSCLITQKETKEKNDHISIKCLLTSCDILPEDFIVQLQENHCMEYQLVIYSCLTTELEKELELISKNRKTGYGKDWYKFTDDDLAQIISIYFRNGKVVFDFTSISDILNHKFTLTFNEGSDINIPNIKPDIIPNINRPNITQKFDIISTNIITSDITETPNTISDIITDITPNIISDINNEPAMEKSERKDRSESDKKERSESDKKDRSEPERKERSESERKERSEFERRERSGSKGFVIKLGDINVPKSDYLKFISSKCILDKDSKVNTIKLNDHFINYLHEVYKYKISDPDDKEKLFKGFIRMGYEITENRTRFYIQGIKLK